MDICLTIRFKCQDRFLLQHQTQIISHFWRQTSSLGNQGSCLISFSIIRKIWPSGSKFISFFTYCLLDYVTRMWQLQVPDICVLVSYFLVEFQWKFLYMLIFEVDNDRFFCAIEPGLRSSWARCVRDLLKPDGELITLMFPVCISHFMFFLLLLDHFISKVKSWVTRLLELHQSIWVQSLYKDSSTDFINPNCSLLCQQQGVHFFFSFWLVTSYLLLSSRRWKKEIFVIPNGTCARCK